MQGMSETIALSSVGEPKPPLAPVTEQEWTVLGFVLVMLFASYVLGVWRRMFLRRHEKADFSWFFTKRLSPFSNEWTLLLLASSVFTAVLLLVSMVSIYVYRVANGSPGPSSLTEQIFAFPGIIFVFASGVLGVASVLNTVLLLRRNAQEIQSFNELAFILQAEARSGRRSQLARIAETYFVDYLPVVGYLSDKAAQSGIFKALKDLASDESTTSHFIVLAPKEWVVSHLHRDSALSGVPRSVGPREYVVEQMLTKALNDVDEVALFKEAIAASDDAGSQLDVGRGALWFSTQVTFEHYYVDLDSAIAYYVIPDERGKEDANVVLGSVITDASHVRYLSDVCKTYLRQAVTPELAKLKREDDGFSLTLSFPVGQQKIKNVIVEIFGAGKSKLKEVAFELDELCVAPGKIYQFLLDVEPDWIKVRLRKDRPLHRDTSPESPSSFFVPVDKSDAASPRRAVDPVTSAAL